MKVGDTIHRGSYIPCNIPEYLCVRVPTLKYTTSEELTEILLKWAEVISFIMLSISSHASFVCMRLQRRVRVAGPMEIANAGFLLYFQAFVTTPA